MVTQRNGLKPSKKTMLETVAVHPSHRQKAFCQNVWIATYGAAMADALTEGMDIDAAHAACVPVADLASKRVLGRP